MCLKERLQYLLKSRKGNALLLATAGAIASTFAVYFFVSITTLSEESKQRVAHLYNAYTMGEAVKAKIEGEGLGINHLDGTQTEPDIEEKLKDIYDNGSFVTLSELIEDRVIVVGMDPTQTQYRGTDIAYDHDVSGVLIKYADELGAIITPVGETDNQSRKNLSLVHDVHLFVNLAGNTDGTADGMGSDNGPYDLTSPFYYIVMASDADISEDSETGRT